MAEGLWLPKVQSENRQYFTHLIGKVQALDSSSQRLTKNMLGQAQVCVHTRAHTQSPIASQNVPGGQQLITGTLTWRLPEAAPTAGPNKSLT